MEVQSYLIEDAEALISDPSEMENFKQLIEELGLEGQQELIGDGGTACPFPVMERGTKRVLETVFPKKTEVKAFRSEVIPIRVLSLIALAEREKYFDRIHVWHSETHEDPVVVGQKGSEWSGEHYLIARWGTALLPMERLYEMALEKKRDDLAAEAQEKIAELTAVANNPTAVARKFLNGDHVSL